ncbi:hypothetical protein PAPYR_11079 [Paratrimastix pyriformis]|uniref:Uncharacterized protein n=1 Tax=Paratrimastix pyriformis TaxID=342808 RepID=A0ABQ8U4J4_9EUKA|nr:hypothetical protein PAPYR_11079 [Paratrimastix pyriformis]
MEQAWENLEKAGRSYFLTNWRGDLKAQIASRNNFRKYVISYAKAEARHFRTPPAVPPYRMNEAEKAAVKQAYQTAKAEAIAEYGNPDLARTKEERTALMKQVNGAALRASATLGAQIRREGRRGGVGWSLRMPGHHDANPYTREAPFNRYDGAEDHQDGFGAPR